MVDRRHLWTEPIPERKKKPAGWQPRVVLHGQFGTGQDAAQGWEVPTYTPPQTAWFLKPGQSGWTPPQDDQIVVPHRRFPDSTPPVPTFGSSEPEQPEEDAIRILSGPQADNPAVAMQAQTDRNRLILPQEDDEESTPQDIVLPGSDGGTSESVALPGGGSPQAALTGAGTLRIDRSSPEAFLGSFVPAARRALSARGLPQSLAPILAAIPMNEQGWQADAPGNNYYGIKGSNPRTGANTGPVGTWEDVGGRQDTTDTFRAYDSPEESVADFLDFLRDNPRYAAALEIGKSTGDPDAFVRAIHAAGYATDRSWSDKILNIASRVPNVVEEAPRGQPVAQSNYDIAFDFNQPYGGAQFNPSIPNHRGVDLVVKGAKDGGRGSPVGAFQGGTVAAVTHDPNGGNGVIIQAPNGLYHRYFHFDTINVKQGQQIAAGTPIGILGASGTEGFPHVHFEVSKGINGDPMDQLIDPRPYMTVGSNLVGEGQSSVRNLTNGQTLSGSVERATTPEAKAQGLIGRVDAGGGMLLEGTNRVHMRGMQIPLDIAYFDQKGKVLAVHTLQPGETGPEVPGAVHAVELPAGRAQETDTQPGDRLGVGQNSDYGPFDPPGYRDWQDQPYGEGPPMPEPIVIPVYTPEGKPAEPIEIPVEHPADRGWPGQVSDAVQGAAQGAGDLVQGATQGLSDVATGAATEVQRRLSPESDRGETARRDLQAIGESPIWPTNVINESPLRPGGPVASTVNDLTGREEDERQRARLREIQNTAYEQGYRMSLNPEFEKANPELAAEQQDLLTKQAIAIGMQFGPQGSQFTKKAGERGIEQLARLGGDVPSVRPPIYGPLGEILSPSPVQLPDHPVGFGIVGNDADPRTLARLHAETPNLEYPGGIPMDESHQAGLKVLALDQPLLEAKRAEVLKPGFTATGARDISAFKTQAEGALENAARLQDDVARLQRLADENSSPDAMEQLQIATRLLQAADDSATLDVRVSRRLSEFTARALAQLKYSFSAKSAQRVVSKVEQLSASSTKAQSAVDDVLNGRRLGAKLGDLDQLADELDANGELLDQKSAGVRAARQGVDDVAEKRQGKVETPPEQQSLAEKLGALEREHMGAHGDDARQAEIGVRREALLDEIRAAADEKAQAYAARAGKGVQDLTPEEVEKIVNQAIGSPTVSMLDREAMQVAQEQMRAAGIEPNPIKMMIDQIKAGERLAVKDDRGIVGYWMKAALDHPADGGIREAMHEAIDRVATHGEKGRRLAVQIRQQFAERLTASYDRLMGGVEARNARAAAQDRATIERVIDKLTVQDMTSEARDVMRRVVQFPNHADYRARFDTLLDDMRLTGERGATAADNLAAQLEKQEQATSRRGAFKDAVREQRAQKNWDKISIQALSKEIKELTAAARANPDIAAVRDAFGDTRLTKLFDDLKSIGMLGQEQASAMRERMFKAGIQRLAHTTKVDEDEIGTLVKMLREAKTPEDIGKLVRALRQPNFVDYINEYQYVNMLSSPVTHGLNTASNVLQVTGRLAFNSLEVLGDPLVNRGNRATAGWAEVGAAWRGARGGVGVGIQEARQVMRTGQRPENYTRALEMAELRGVRREILTEKFGRLGAVIHSVSTRPLEAMDVMLGNIAYGSAVQQYATREAAKMLQTGDARVQGMDLDRATRHVLANIWDHQAIFEKAGKIRDYTLLKTQGENKLEQAMRVLASHRNAGPNAGLPEQLIAFVGNMFFPFYNVPLNFMKQGVDRSLGAPVNAARLTPLSGRYQATDAVERVELFKRASVGAATLGLATTLVAGDNLTGEGPSFLDPDKRKLWEETHRPNSVRIPGTDRWISWEGTPVAMPFAMVANAKESLQSAQEKAGQQGLSAGDTALTGGYGAAKGLGLGFLSNSFIGTMADTYKSLTGYNDFPSAWVAGEASRFSPLSSGIRWLARITDTMERDVTGTESPSEDVVNRMKMAYPGARQTLPEAVDVMGRPRPNQSFGVPGFFPFRPGRTPNANDPIIQAFTRAGVSISDAPRELSYSGVKGAKLPLSKDEQNAFQAARGKVLLDMLKGVDLATVDGDSLRDFASTSQQLATDSMMANLSPAEIKRRMKLDVPKGEEGSRESRKRAADMLVDLNDTAKFPRFVLPDGSALGTPSDWPEMQKELALQGAMPERQRAPWYQNLVDAKKNADVKRLVESWDSPNYDDYERYVVGQIGASMTNKQWADYQSGASPKYSIPGTGPADWREMDRRVKLYRALPTSSPMKAQLRPQVKDILSRADPDWRKALEYNELSGRKESGELDALNSIFMQGLQP